MSKMLFVTAALLAPGFAHAGDPSADLSVQVVPASSTSGCGTPPAAAQAVGFTTCALNSDFTQTLPSNYINCSGADDSSYTWFRLDDYGGCSPGVTQTTDPQSGSMTLDLRWYPNEGAGHPITELATKTADNSVSHDFPYGYYEAVFRVQPSPDDGSSPNFASGGEYIDFWSNVDIAQNSYGLELDFMEFFQVFGTNPGMSTWNWSNTSLSLGSGVAQTNVAPDMRQYHTWAALVTGNSGGQYDTVCMYFDGQQMGCGNQHLDNSSQNEANERYAVRIQMGTICQFPPTDLSCMPGWLSQLDAYIKTIRVWSCSSWQTTKCVTF